MGAIIHYILTLIAACAFVGIGCSSGSLSTDMATLSADDSEFLSSPPGEDGEDSQIFADENSEPGMISPRDGQPPVRDNLPKEHTLVVNRRCRLEKAPLGGWHRLQFENEPKKAPQASRMVLPGPILREMELIQERNPNVVFIVTGETVLFKKKPYLLARLAQSEESAPPTLEPAVTPDGESAASTAPAPETSSAPASQDAVDPDEIIARLIAQSPANPILPPSERPSDVVALPSVAPVIREQLKRSLGQFISDRVVRVSKDPDTGWWICHFESDNTLQDQPVRLLPSARLAAAQRLSSTATGRGVKLRVSGEMFQYKGREYLLLRKAQKEAIMGQI